MTKHIIGYFPLCHYLILKKEDLEYFIFHCPLDLLYSTNVNYECEVERMLKPLLLRSYTHPTKNCEKNAESSLDAN